MKLSKKKKQGGTGRPPKWASGKTTPIRVPVVFLKKVLAFINELEASIPFLNSERPDPPRGK